MGRILTLLCSQYWLLHSFHNCFIYFNRSCWEQSLIGISLLPSSVSYYCLFHSLISLVWDKVMELWSWLLTYIYTLPGVAFSSSYQWWDSKCLCLQKELFPLFFFHCSCCRTTPKSHTCSPWKEEATAGRGENRWNQSIFFPHEGTHLKFHPEVLFTEKGRIERIIWEAGASSAREEWRRQPLAVLQGPIHLVSFCDQATLVRREATAQPGRYQLVPKPVWRPNASRGSGAIQCIAPKVIYIISCLLGSNWGGGGDALVPRCSGIECNSFRSR